MDSYKNIIYILGDSSTGKTSLINKIKGNIFNEEEAKGYGITTSVISMDNTKLTFRDLSDDKDWRFTKIYESEIDLVKCSIIVFDITRPATLKYAADLVNLILNSASNKYMTIILCGNKSDLPCEVKYDDIHELIRGIPDCYYVELSCKNNSNVDKVLDTLKNLNLDNNENYMLHKEPNRRGTMINDKDPGSCNIL